MCVRTRARRAGRSSRSLLPCRDGRHHALTMSHVSFQLSRLGESYSGLGLGQPLGVWDRDMKWKLLHQIHALLYLRSSLKERHKIEKIYNIGSGRTTDDFLRLTMKVGSSQSSQGEEQSELEQPCGPWEWVEKGGCLALTREDLEGTFHCRVTVQRAKRKEPSDVLRGDLNVESQQQESGQAFCRHCQEQTAPCKILPWKWVHRGRGGFAFRWVS